MTYFEAKERLKNLEKFRDFYREYIEFTNRENNIPAQIVRKKMMPLADLTVDSLRRIKIGSIITREAPVQGGGKIKINLIRAIFRDHIIRRFKLDDETPLKLLDRGVARYQVYVWKEKIQLFNPLFWLYHGTEYLTRLPIILCHKLGIETYNAENTISYKLGATLFQLMVLFIFLKAIGLFSWLNNILFS